MDRKIQIPILTDTEAETSIDLDASLQQLNDQQNASKSVFNISLKEFEDSESVKLSVDHGYEKRLQQEAKDWGQLWRDALKQLKQLKCEPHPTVDASLLSADKRAYLEAKPCLQKFLRDSIEFRVAANIFLEDCAEVQTMEANLIEECERSVNNAKEVAIAKSLAATKQEKTHLREMLTTKEVFFALNLK